MAERHSRRKHKADEVPRHRKVRVTCVLCGHTHTHSQHDSHGIGSFHRHHHGKRKHEKRKHSRRRK